METDLKGKQARNTYGADDQLAEGIRRRDTHSMEVLYDRLSRQAFGLAYRILGDGPSAEDVVQEAFLALWRQAERLDPLRGKLPSFVMTVVHHKAIDVLRAKRGQSGRELSLDPWIAETGSPDASEWIIQSLRREAVVEALKCLPEDQRRAIDMAYFEGLTHVEIAGALALPLGTVKSRLRLGLEKMRAMLAKEADAMRRS